MAPVRCLFKRLANYRRLLGYGHNKYIAQDKTGWADYGSVQAVDKAFLEFCGHIGVEPNDERYLFWIAGRHVDEPPAAWGMFGADGCLIGMVDALPPRMRPTPVPLYRQPTTAIRPPITPQTIDYVWANYDGDIVGYTRWLEDYIRKQQCKQN